MSKLKPYLIQILFIASLLLLHKQAKAQFVGGASDGHSNTRLLNLVCVTTNVNPFAGGQSDGHSNTRLSNVVCVPTNVNPFSGGQSDGHSNTRLSNVVCSVTNVNPFSGGQSDGHSNTRLSNVVCSVTNVNPFGGGQSDGHSNTRLSNIVCVVTNVNPFAGGQSDGHSNININNFPINTCTTVPVQMLSFEAFCSEDFVNVSWITATEIDNKHFEIEKSSDGLNFSSIGIVEGAGNSNQQQYYLYKDVGKSNRIVYYRLKQTDYQGHVDYSTIVMADCMRGNSAKTLIYPNPGLNELIIETATNTNNQQRVEIIDGIGQIVYQGVIFHKHFINTTNYASGVYLIKLENGESYKWIKQK
jgi:hypothetical protein